MNNKKLNNLAIFGTGWSGSGALIDLLIANANVSKYPYELDFWRKPGGMMEATCNTDFRKFAMLEIFNALVIIFKSFIKCLLFRTDIRDHFKMMVCQVKMVFCLVASFFTSLLNYDYPSVAQNFLNNFRFFFGKDGTTFVYDQPVFIEQMLDDNLGYLSSNACIFVVRDVFDQLQDLLNHAAYLKPATIRESFFVGANQGHDLGLSTHQMRIMLATLKKRISFLHCLLADSPNNFLVIKFEHLVTNPQSTISILNDFLVSAGFPDQFISDNNTGKVFDESQKNVGIGRKLHSLDVEVVREMSEINSDIDKLLKLSVNNQLGV